MTPHDRKTLFTALAFVLVVVNEGDTPSDISARVSQYAGQIEAFCAACDNDRLTADAYDTVDQTDHMIERHLRELKDRQETCLPENHETLICLHDRLQHRKARRDARAFYASAVEEELADAVLRLLEEEIETARAVKIV